MFPVLYEVDAFTVAATTPVVSGVGTMGTRGTLYLPPQVQDLYPVYHPSQRCGLCQNFKQTTLTTSLYKVRKNLYPPYEKVPTRLSVVAEYSAESAKGAIAACRTILRYLTPS